MALIYHCADIHIGKGRTNPKRQEDFFQSLCYIAKDALQNNADVLLICGDLFDRREIDPAALRQVSYALSPLKEAGIVVCAIEGNHDKATYHQKESWLSYLDSQKLLHLLQWGDEILQPYNEGGNVMLLESQAIRIIGMPYSGARSKTKLEQMAEKLAPYEGYTILMMHAPVGKMAGVDYAYIPSDTLSLLEDKVDYIALGHMHTRYEVGIAHNPGAPECVNLDEAFAGEKGYFKIDTKKGVDFMAYPGRALVLVHADITNASDADAAMEEILEKLESKKQQIQNNMVSLEISGKASFDPSLLDLARAIDYLESLEVVEMQTKLMLQSDVYQPTLYQNRADIEKEVILNKLGTENKHMLNLVLGVKASLEQKDNPTETMHIIQQFVQEEMQCK